MSCRKKIAIITIFLCLVSVYPMTRFLIFRSTRTAYLLLRELSPEEKNDLETFCQYLIKNTEFGYTLFGTKPVTLLSPECSEKIVYNKSRSIYEKGLPILKRICSAAKIKKYILLCKDNGRIELDVVNKDLFVKTVVENRDLFDQLGHQTSDPEQLLIRLLEDGNFSKNVCHDNEVLLGICLGYGKQNCLLAGRRSQLGMYFSQQGNPPWNYSKTILSDDERIFLKLDPPHFFTNLSPKHQKAPKKVELSPGVTSFENDLKYLQTRLSRSTSAILEDISSVQIPVFWCDQHSNETIELLEKYKQQQKILRKLLVSESIVEEIFNKLIEE